MQGDLLSHLGPVPRELAAALDGTFRDMLDHFLKAEWDDAQVDAGRFCEAALRYLEWKMTGAYTPIDGKNKPDRKRTVNAARGDTALQPSLRAQVPQAIELAMDFRNNRNAAHLGDIDANKADAACVVQDVSWVVGEIARLESQQPVAAVQGALDGLAERHVPLVQTVGDHDIVLDPEMKTADQVLVLLYSRGHAVPTATLRTWTGYSNSTRFRDVVIKGLARRRLVHVDRSGDVTLLRTGQAEAQRLLLASAA